MRRTHPAYAAIMAGGIGERFWPISSPDRPKQLLPLAGNHRTLLQATADRLAGLIDPEYRFIVTSEALRPVIARHGVQVPPEQVLAEPAKRSTLGAILYATAAILRRSGADPDDVTMAVLPADHYIGDDGAFRRTAASALAAAREHDALVVVGIQPDRPETGYGYIEVDGTLEPDSSCADARRVLSFREKPDRTTARGFLKEGRFLWNAGMFFWRVGTFLDQLAQAAPHVHRMARRLISAMAHGDAAAVRRHFCELPDVSIDYALMERAPSVLVVRAQFPWDDLGSWDAYARINESDGNGNVVTSGATIRDSRRCVVYNDLEQRGIEVTLLGVEDLVVAAGPAGILVMPVQRAQEVRTVARRSGAIVPRGGAGPRPANEGEGSARTIAHDSQPRAGAGLGE
ncbi:MAG: mannose-1-phosphate guanylyltransferase [Armatimonadota bacterium]